MATIQENNISQGVAAEIQTLDEAADFVSHPDEPFYLEAEFWVGMAFVLVVVFLARPVAKALKNLLAKHRDGVILQISQAEKLRDDAQVLLSQYERQFLNAKNEAQAILDKSNKEIELLKENTLTKLENDLNARRKEVENKITAETEKYHKEINELIGVKTVSLVKEKLAAVLDNDTHTKLIDNSIEKILKKIN